ncbi:MAG: kelch repeat-containing protein [Candidatus Thorarchaeota archaeon]
MKKRIVQAVVLVMLILTVLQVPVVANEGTWTEMSPEDIPPSRLDANLVFDNGSDVAILFGGALGDGVRAGDTWAYSYESDEWTNMSPSVAPPARAFAQMAYDSGSDRVILFSGAVTQEFHFNDTWAYDYDSNTWTNLSPPVMPSPRRYASMEYDVESDRIILFGGILGTGGTTGDTWAFDYDTNTWENMDPSSAPSARMYSVMAYDSESDRIILFSGCYPGVFTDTWAYDYNTNTWQNMNPSENPGAYPGSMVYDAEEDLCVTYVGAIDFDETQLTNESWAYDYDSNTWTEYTISTSPGVRTRGLLVYDHNSDVTILHGGLGLGRFDERLNDTWSFASQEPTTTPTNGGSVLLVDLILVTTGIAVVILVIVVFVRRR